MLTVIIGAYFNVFITFSNVSMTYPILVHLIVRMYSHSYGVCIKAYMAINGKKFQQMNNQWWVIVQVIYVNIIIVTLVSWYITDWHSLYRIKYKILSTHSKCLPVVLKLSATTFLWLRSNRLQLALKINLNFKLKPTVDIELVVTIYRVQ